MSSALDGRESGETIEILQHWAAENSPALDVVIEEFERRGAADVENNAAHISTLRLHVKSRILGEDPPDVWADWPGRNLEPAVDIGAVDDVTDVWRDAGMESAYVEGAIEAARFDGRFRCVPLDIYRINNLFYDVDRLREVDRDVEDASTVEDFFDLLAALEAQRGEPPFLVGGKDPFGLLQLWETFLIAHGGARGYEALLEGETSAHRDTVRRAVESVERCLEYAPEEVKFLASEEADERFAAGDAAVFHNGAWAIGRIQATAGYAFGDDWEHVPFPGTADAFQMNMNALVPAAGASDATREFLAFAGSADALEIFNGEAGAVPPRNDVPTDSLHPLTQRLSRDAERIQAHLPSMTHGLGVSPGQLVDLKDVIATHFIDRDVDETTRRFVDVLSDVDE